MTRRLYCRRCPRCVAWSGWAALVGLCLVTAGCAPSGDSDPPFDVLEKSIAELGEAMTSGVVTSEELVTAYLERIAAYDQEGPRLNAVVTLNPDARADAAMLDQERAGGRVRGRLHGIPVLVKDNYDTANLPTSAGAIGLATSIPPDDAFQVRKLKEAGAVILGKTNMHELARGITTVGSLAGQTRNPYDPTRNPGGSSGGTGAAIGASFAAVGMGSDTCGSIRIPSAHQALVGLRGTRGLASGDGIVPLSTTQDIGGPLARSVEDLAITLDATVGPDPADETTALSEGQIPDTYTAFLDPAALAGARIGVVLALMGEGGAEQSVRDVVETAIDTMTTLGADVMEIEEPDVTELLADSSVIGLEFKFDLDAYLEQTPGAGVRSLSELVELGLLHEIVSDGVDRSLEIESLATSDYRERIAKRDVVQQTVIGLLEEHNLDALVYPTIRLTARPIGQAQPGSNCQLSAISGLPAITVPGGFAEDGMPVGVELLGRPFAEPRLIELAYAFEQATHHRRPPDFTPSLVSPPSPVTLSVELTSAAPDQVQGQARFVLDPATRTLTHSVSAYGLRDRDVLTVDVHRTRDDADTGPTLRLLARHRARVSGRWQLTGYELARLRAGELYLDVHTPEHLAGVLRVDLAMPAGRD